MSVTEQDWQATARELRESGLSEREIAEQLGKSRSTIHKHVQDVVPRTEADDPEFEYPASEGGDNIGGPQPTAGQQTIDGGEVPASSANGAIHPEEIRVDGTTQLGLIDFGGKQPQSATITLRGGAYELLEGRAFRKGDVIRFEGTAVVNFVGGRDKADPKTGIVVTAKQVHEARILDLRVTGEGG